MFTNKVFELIKKYEGFSAVPYICPAGYYTIGYGRILSQDEIKNLSNIRTTKEQEEIWLRKKVFYDYLTIFPWIKVFLHPYCWDAILSLVYNIGTYRFKASTLLRKINHKEFSEAGNQFLRWIYVGGKPLKGLIKRREEERALFMEGIKCLMQ